MALVPAYGRDYKSAKETKQAFLDGKDFILYDITSPWDGKPCSIRDFDPGQHIELRYANMTGVTLAKVPKAAAAQE